MLGRKWNRPVPEPGAKKDPNRGVSPERFDAFTRVVDDQLGEMARVFIGDKPARGRKADRLLVLTRSLKLMLERFEGEIEASI